MPAAARREQAAEARMRAVVPAAECFRRHDRRRVSPGQVGLSSKDGTGAGAVPWKDFPPAPTEQLEQAMNITKRLALCVCLAAVTRAAESDALRLNDNIVARHLPFGAILDPFVDQSGGVTGYTRCGDSALWTGHYLAAQAFRYQVTRTPEAMDQVRAALRGLRSLVDVTGSDRLARCLVPADSPFAAGILSEEAHHGSYPGRWDGADYHWVGNTSRDQFSGVFFGLAAAWEFVDDAGVRTEAASLASRLLDRLISDGWAVIMPDGRVSTVFWHRPDQQLAFLQTGQRMDPGRYGDVYRLHRLWKASVAYLPIAIEAADPHNSCFKFNLNAINLWQLLRGGEDGFYRWRHELAYGFWRRGVAAHGNAHFNMIDRAVRGPDADRDAETRALLEAWLRRPLVDQWVDWRGVYPSCVEEDRACEPLPVQDRVRTDFLWQRSPFLLYGGGSGTIESPGIDYILPYWMARYYGVLGPGQ